MSGAELSFIKLTESGKPVKTRRCGDLNRLVITLGRVRSGESEAAAISEMGPFGGEQAAEKEDEAGCVNEDRQGRKPDLIMRRLRPD